MTFTQRTFYNLYEGKWVKSSISKTTCTTNLRT